MYRAMTTVLMFSVALVTPGAGQAQIPPGYEIVQVTQNPYYEPVPRMNNCGQFVFMRWYDVSDRLTEEIFLYDNGELIRVTDDYVQDVGPDMNDDGTIVWARGIGPINPDTGQPTLEIVMWQDGDLTRLTDNDVQDVGPSINNVGQVVWDRYMGEVCGGHTAMDVFLYDGHAVQQITTDGLSDEVANQAAEINDFGEIVWTRYDFCVDPYESDVMMYSDGVITQISPDDVMAPRGVTINNVGQVAWLFQIGWGEHGIQLWQDGVVTLFTDWGSGPRLNDRGDMCFFRWYEQQETYEMWLYSSGALYQLTEDPFWNVAGDIDNLGQVVWSSGDYPWADIRLMRRVRPVAQGSQDHAAPVDVRPVWP